MAEQRPRVLITGAAGFVGLHLAEYLMGQGYTQVHGTSLSNNEALAAVIGNDHVHHIDLTHIQAVQALLREVSPDWIVHLAAMAEVGSSFERGLEVIQTNTTLQYSMLEAIRQIIPRARLLSISSAHVYGSLLPEWRQRPIDENVPLRPNNPYGVSKLTQDMLALSYHLAYGLNVVRVRPFNQIGPRQAPGFVVSDFARQIVQIERGEQTELLVGNLAAQRDFTDVRDAVRAYELLLQRGVAGEVYNLGSGVGVKIQELLEHMCSLATVPIRPLVDPAKIRPVDIPLFVADNTKICQLGWMPRLPLEQTLRDVVSYERTRK